MVEFDKQKEAPVAAGTTGALVAQGANSNGWLEDEPLCLVLLAGVAITGSIYFPFSSPLHYPPLISSAATRKKSSHNLFVYRLRDPQ